MGAYLRNQLIELILLTKLKEKEEREGLELSHRQ